MKTLQLIAAIRDILSAILRAFGGVLALAGLAAVLAFGGGCSSVGSDNGGFNFSLKWKVSGPDNTDAPNRDTVAKDR